MKREYLKREYLLKNHDTEPLKATDEKQAIELKRKGAMKAIHANQEKPRCFTRVNTLQEAVELSLLFGLEDHRIDVLFDFARALKAFELTHNRNLPEAELHAAFSLWWQTAEPDISTNADCDEYRFFFLDAFKRAKMPLGANPLEEAIHLTDTKPMPPAASRYASTKLKRLVAVCHHLQMFAGNSAFFLSARDAARVVGTKNNNHALSFLNGLVRDGVLTVVEKGVPGGKWATRYRFNFGTSKSSES